MKKIICMLVSAIIILSCFSFGVSAETNTDKVRIEFCVGDDILLINGVPVSVEKPYVVGEGVTLVPLRVITEAFGAKVEWTDATQSIDLSYPDVNIHLKIGSEIAEVNGKAETLLSAPELTNSYTMVPLRFISETFGAVVSYDEATEKIVVEKEDAVSGNIVEGAVSNARVGDSYYNWSMENPGDFSLTYRSFEGLSTYYNASESDEICIEIEPLADDFVFENFFNDYKNYLQGLTLVKADKDVSDPSCRKMHFQVKDKSFFGEIRMFFTKDYFYYVSGTFSDETIKENGLRILSTFVTEFSGEDIYDYSDLKDGLRTFEVTDLNLSFGVPADYYMTSSEYAENEFEFECMNEEYANSALRVSVYSKSDVISAQELAKKDYESNRLFLNEEITVMSDSVKEVSYGNIVAYEYQASINQVPGKFNFKDIFFECGEYVYNFSIDINENLSDLEEMVQKIMTSVKFEEIDSSKVGIFMRNEPECTGVIPVEIDNVSLEIPNIYQEVYENTFVHMTKGVMLTIEQNKKVRNSKEMKNAVKELGDIINDEAGSEIIATAKEEAIDGVKCVKQVSSVTNEDEGKVYIEIYGVVKNNAGYIFTVMYPEMSYSSYARSEIAGIIKSLK